MGLPLDGSLGGLALLDEWLDASFGRDPRPRPADALGPARERAAALMLGSAFGQLAQAVFGGGWSDDPSAPDDVAAARFVCATGVAIRPLERVRVRVREGADYSLVRYLDATLKALGRTSEDPSLARSWLAAGELLLSAGRVGAARAALVRANSVGPTGGDAARAIDRCDELLARRAPPAGSPAPPDPPPAVTLEEAQAPPPGEAGLDPDVAARAALDAATRGDTAALDHALTSGWGALTATAREGWITAFEGLATPEARSDAVPAACLLAERLRAAGHVVEAVGFLSVAARRLAPGLPPGPRAALSRELAEVLAASGPAGHKEAVQVLDGTLTMLDGKAPPRELARLALSLAGLLVRRGGAAKREDVDRAVFVVGRAVRQTARDDDRELWGELQLALGTALRARRGTSAGEAELAFERAAEALSPGTVAWALAQQGVGVSCVIAGASDPAKIDEAIQLFDASLVVLDPSGADAVRSHYHLGLAYQRRRAGARGDNLDKAVAHYRAALAAPVPGAAAEQAAAEDNLAIALRDLRKNTGPRTL